jgi:hypothetical protein
MNGFVPSDFVTVAWLLYNNIPVENTTRNGSRMEFTFSQPEKCRKLQMSLLANQATCEVNKMFSAFRAAKKLVHSMD